jgi:hypothetical protein
MAGTEWHPATEKAIVFLGLLIGQVTPFVLITYGPLGPDSVSKADILGTIAAKSKVTY